jgi:gluconate 2-dehydrogenase gamma chain
MDKHVFDRRNFLIGGTLASTAGAAALTKIHDGELGAPSADIKGGVPWTEGTADVPPVADLNAGYAFFSDPEAAFIEAAVERLIPSDPVGPGALEAGVPQFLDRQLLGAFGRGDHYYLGGPWPKGTPEQGYQSRFNPAQLYRAAMAEIDKYTAIHFNGVAFAKTQPADQDQILKDLEVGKITLGSGVDGKTFFSMLLQNTKEGYLSDPIYGGNKDMGSWKMIGFPGAHYDYSEWVERHNERVPYPPVSLLGRPGWKEA